MLKETLFVLAAVVIQPLSISVWSQTPPEVVVENGVAMKTRDGITLRADIYRPDAAGGFPVLVMRTPYDKGSAYNMSSSVMIARQAAARGYLVVVQDVRGRFSSDGEWYPFKHETEDGYDTVEWAATLPHSNGKVGMFGGSYVGATQMLAAIGHPPHLAGICPMITASNYHENWTYQGGALEQWFDESWTSGLALNTLNRDIVKGRNTLVGSAVLPLRNYPLFNLRIGPGSASSTEAYAPYFLDWLDHPLYDSYWKQWSIEENYQNIQVPALTIAAWYDIFQGGSLRNYLGLKDHGGTEAARRTQYLIVGIGGHGGGWGPKVGAVDFGSDAPFDDTAMMLDWYDYLFKGIQNEFATQKPVRLFVMGENKWRYEDTWPLKRAERTAYFLHSAGKANSTSGDGNLSTKSSTELAGQETADNYVYDPANPVPTVGGPLCCDFDHLAAGPQDQREVESRSDVLVYSTPPLDRDLEVTGPVMLDLFAKSSAVDTDFTAKLVDVWPNGFAQNLTEGILRARYRESTSASTPIVPGTIYEYKIDLWSTSNVFLKGHRIRLEVSSSNFPRFDRNLNTGNDASKDSVFVKATNTVLHDSEHPSALVLPVVPK